MSHIRSEGRPICFVGGPADGQEIPVDTIGGQLHTDLWVAEQPGMLTLMLDPVVEGQFKRHHYQLHRSANRFRVQWYYRLVNPVPSFASHEPRPADI